ncbi:histidinol-phosphate transaminase [Mariniluteicoccus flavus]
MGVRIRGSVSALPPYRAGKPAPLGPDGVSFKLSSNENPYEPLPGVLEAVQAACGQMNRYPDATNTAITDRLAAALSGSGVDVTGDNLVFGTGSVTVLATVLHAACEAGDEVVYAWRSFEAYPIAVQLAEAVPVPVPLAADGTHDLAAMRAAVTDRTRVVMLCTPNNPTGPTIPHDELVAFVDDLPDHVLVLVDEAYVEFVTDPAATRGLDVWQGRPNVVVLRTFSKAYGLAGFRVGYAVAHPDVAAALKACTLPFAVSVPAQAAVVASLDAHDALMERVDALVAEREVLVDGLRGLGFTVPQAQGNFVWIPAREKSQAYADAFAEAGIMVRVYVAGNDQDGVRITVGEPEANRLALEVAGRLER